MHTFFVLTSMAICGAMANTVPSRMGIEVVRRDDGNVIVREVAHQLRGDPCTNCVDVGGTCTIGEGNCMSSQSASCTDCGGGRVICVDTNGGSCDAP